MAQLDEIDVRGLRELNARLRAVDSQLPKGLRLAGNRAADIVVAAARPRVPVGPGRGGHAASSIKARSTRTAARVSGGGKRFAYYPWLDFGGTINPRPGTAIERPFIQRGRYIWPAFVDNRQRVVSELDTALREVARDAGIQVR